MSLLGTTKHTASSLRGCAASRRQHLASAAPRPYSLNTPSLQLAAPAAAAADAPATSTSAPPKQHQQQKRAAGRNHQQPKQQQQRAPQRRVIPAVLPPPLTDKPFLVRVAGRTSSIQGCAGAIVKRLRTDDLIRVAAIDTGSIPTAVLALTAANNMVAGNNGQMLVFQPTLTTTVAEEPKIPKGSYVMYTGAIMAGEVLTDNVLLVKGKTDKQSLAGAIAARMRSNAHTVLECYGSSAVSVTIEALSLARRYLLTTNQDLACIIASGRKDVVAADGDGADGGGAAGGGAAEGDSSQAAAAAAGGGGGAAGSSSSSTSSRYPATCHRFVVLECEPRRPRALLVKASMGLTDRVAPYPAPQQADASTPGPEA